MNAWAPLLLMAVIVSPPGFRSCTCQAPQDWSIEEARKQGAVFAEVTQLGERELPQPGPNLRIYVGRVHRAIGLKPGATIDILTPADPAGCGVTLEPGERRWLLLRPHPEGWSAELCSQLPLKNIRPMDWNSLALP